MGGNSISIWQLILNADPIVKGVMLILLAASIGSWTVIVQRVLCFINVNKALREFEEKFWSGADLSKLYRSIEKEAEGNLGSGQIFKAGFKDFLRMQQKAGMTPDATMDAVQRAMRVAFMRETDRLEHGLSLLATIGSVSPYVGLFGTVWGIMHSFQSLSGVEQATLSMVAPGISEALVATAMGLFVAIPAVVAYNRFSARTERFLNEYENFQDEFAGILHRELYSQRVV